MKKKMRIFFKKKQKKCDQILTLQCTATLYLLFSVQKSLYAKEITIFWRTIWG